jgi:hypothetical protein
MLPSAEGDVVAGRVISRVRKHEPSRVTSRCCGRAEPQSGNAAKLRSHAVVEPPEVFVDTGDASGGLPPGVTSRLLTDLEDVVVFGIDMYASARRLHTAAHEM